MIEAATRLFLRDGYLATTMAAIAAEAGVAVYALPLAHRQLGTGREGSARLHREEMQGPVHMTGNVSGMMRLGTNRS